MNDLAMTKKDEAFELREYGHIIGNKYCPNCGQRIDWSGEE